MCGISGSATPERRLKSGDNTSTWTVYDLIAASGTENAQ
jgi:hypothetical protein